MRRGDGVHMEESVTWSKKKDDDVAQKGPVAECSLPANLPNHPGKITCLTRGRDNEKQRKEARSSRQGIGQMIAYNKRQ